MNTIQELTTVPNTQLINALDKLGVDFLLQTTTDANMTVELDPAVLIKLLISNGEARLRLALIPLLLRHPGFAVYVPTVVDELSVSARLVLRCYYTAALLLQQKYRSRLQALFGEQDPLIDFFSADLQVPLHTDPDAALRALAECQRTLSGQSINWLGTYEHAAQRFMTHLEKQHRWNS